MKEVYALFGKPLQHSQSPLLHRHFADQVGREIEYRLIETDLSQLERSIKEFFFAGGFGANVTSPYKQQVISLLDDISPSASVADAVNTISVVNGKLYGDNTDGIGLYRDLLYKEIDLNDKKILILGTGGAARAIYAQLLSQGISNIAMLSREAASMPGDLIINATSAGLDRKIPNIVNKLELQNTICYDCNYGVAANYFLDHAKIRGASKVISGWGMLVEQAAQAFYIWTKYLPNTDEIHSKSPTLS